MKKIFTFSITTLLIAFAYGQGNLSFFHMQNRMPQGSNYNPAYFPDAKVYISLPAISGVDLTVNNSFGIADVLTKTGDSTLVDIDRFFEDRKRKSYLNVGLGLTDFMIGVRLNEKSHFSLFVNDRVDATFFYPMDLLEFLWNGNGAYIGEKYVADDFNYDLTYYREWGLGYARQFTIGGFNTTIGARLKHLTGLVHTSTANNLSVSVLTNEADYSLTASFKDMRLRSAGIAQFEDEGDIDPYYFIYNGNMGFGLDLGAQLQFSDRWRFGAAINDLGFITWKEQAEKVQLSEATFRYNGLNLDNLSEVANALKDSIDNMELDTTAATFTTMLNSRTYFTADYKVTKGGYAQATLANYITQGRLKTSLGLGYLQNVGRWLSASVTASLTPQQGADLGAGLMFKLGYLQVYTVADNIFNTIDLPNAKSANFKFGINFLFGKPGPKKKKETATDKKVVADKKDVYIDDYPDYSYLWDELKNKE